MHLCLKLFNCTKKYVSIALSISLVCSTFSLIPVYADNTLDYTIIFVHTFGKCLTAHNKALKFYAQITDQYFTKYGIPHTSKLLCVSSEELIDVIDALGSYELLIIIPDLFKSVEYSIKSGALGHSYYDGNENAIVSTAISLKAESKQSAWILSHELSHFILAYKGYPRSVSVDWVHNTQSKYTNCQKNDFSLTSCKSLWTSVKSPTGKSIPVMVMYKQQNSNQKTEPTNPNLNKLDRVTVKTINIYNLDATYYSTSNPLHTDDNIAFEVTISNNQAKKQSVVVLLQIQDSNGNTVAGPFWYTISLYSKQTGLPQFYWTPKTSGTYTATFFFWESGENNAAVAPAKSVSFQVYD